MKNKELIQKIREGDTRHLKSLYKYFPVISKWLKANGCKSQETEDIFQEALLVFCEKCKKQDFELTSSLDTYLFSVSKFIYYNKARKERNKTTSDFTDLEIVASNDLEELQEKEEKIDYAFKALEKIGERCQEILKMFYLQKKSMVEIASHMGFQSDKVAKNQKYKCLGHAKKWAFKLINE